MRGKWLFGAAFVALSTFGLGAHGALAQSTDDPPGDNSTAVQLTPGTPINGALSPAGDSDWYKLSVTPGRMYRIALNGAGEDAAKLADPLLVLHGADGAEIARNDDSPGGLDSLLRYTPTQAGTVFVEARGFADDAVGAYTLSADQSVVPPDNAGNDKSTRARIAAGQTAQGALEYEGDTDWFRLRVRTGQIYHISLDGAGADDAKLADPLLVVHDANGDEVARNDDAPTAEDQQGTLNSLLDYVPNANGDVLVEARGFADNASGAYALHVEATALPHDDFANGRNTRGRIAVGQTQRGAIEYGGDVDWLRVTLAEGQVYRFQAKSAAGDGALADPVLRLLDAQGTELATDDDGGDGFNSYLEFTAPRAGNYFVETHSFDATATGAYDVSVAAGDIPGDATTDAALSADGDYREGKIGASGDTDWYRLDMKAGQSVRVALDSPADGIGDPMLVIHGPDGGELASDDDGGEGLNSWLEFTAPSAGAYYIEAKGFSSDAAGAYTINVTAGEIPAQADGAESLVAGSDGRESIISPNGDADWFSVDLVEGRPYRFFVDGAAENGLADPVVTLYDGEGHQVATDDDGGTGANAHLYFASPTGGTYYAAVSSADQAGSGHYTIRASDTDVPGNVGTDEELKADPSDDRASRIEIIGDLDWYRVELVANVHYDINVSGDGDTPLTDPFVAVINSNGEQVATDDDSGPGLDARLRFTPEATDTYYVQANGLSGSTGGYKISIVRR